MKKSKVVKRDWFWKCIGLIVAIALAIVFVRYPGDFVIGIFVFLFFIGLMAGERR